MSLTYQNPVWPGYLADPFVLKTGGEYYAYGTGSSIGDDLSNGRMFPVLHSKDLAHWDFFGGALQPLTDFASTAYWAPEVAERDGKFFMFYSAATGEGDEGHRLRVAIADHPVGPFIDAGREIIPDEGFTIDAHPFRDPKDGQWYLYYAKDFFDERVGTGTAVVPLQDDMMTPADAPRTVLRASSDWHIHARDRHIYNKVWDAWHTVEGPFVVERDGLYYCLYSGGAWHSENYGVSYGVAEHPLGPFRDEWSSEGPTVLRGIPGQVIGPGHNSVVLGPDDQTQFVVYHAWDVAQTARRMCIDPLVWTPDGPRCLGPTTGEQQLQGAD
jgi:beta-xylosidase